MEKRSRTMVYAKEILRELRVSNGYTLEKLGKTVGYTASALAKIEKRHNGLNPRRVPKFLEVFGMEFKDLFEFIEREE